MSDSKLAKYPPGILELLALKSQGKAPDVFSDTLTPTLDAIEFYALDRMVAAVETASAGAIAASFNSTASSFPRRLLALSGSIVVGAAAGTFCRLVLAIVLPGATPVYVGDRNFTPRAANTFVVSASLPPGFVLPPGHTYRLIASGDAAGVDHVLALQYLWHNLDPARF